MSRLLIPVATLMGNSVPRVEKTQEAAELGGKHEFRFDVLELRALYPFLIFTVPCLLLSGAPRGGSTRAKAQEAWPRCQGRGG